MLKPGIEVKHTVIITGRVDLRKGMDSLVAYIKLSHGLDPLDQGTLFLFCGSRRDRIKGIFYEGDGIVMITKRLSDGVFQWPRNSSEAKALTPEQYERLMDGFTIDGTIKVYRQTPTEAGVSTVKA